jgi:hypothetical protein
MRPPFLAHKEPEYRAPENMQDNEYKQTTYAATACQIADRNTTIKGKRSHDTENFTPCQIIS